MPDPVYVQRPFPRASIEQFYGFVGSAAEVVANLFANGGVAVTLEAGHDVRRVKPNSQTGQPQTFEEWQLGLDPGKDEVVLQALCDKDPSGGLGPEEVNPFVGPTWKLRNLAGQPSTVGEILAPHMEDIPPYRKMDALILELSSLDPYYMIQKVVSGVFGMAVSRGDLSVGLALQKGDLVTEEVVRNTIVKTEKTVQQPVLNENNQVIYDEVRDEKGETVMEPAIDPRTNQPKRGPGGGLVMQVKIRPRTQPVTADFEEAVSKKVMVERTPIFLQVARTRHINPQEADRLMVSESAYDPTWMLGDVLTGKHKAGPTFSKMEGG